MQSKFRKEKEKGAHYYRPKIIKPTYYRAAGSACSGWDLQDSEIVLLGLLCQLLDLHLPYSSGCNARAPDLFCRLGRGARKVQRRHRAQQRVVASETAWTPGWR